MKPISPVIIETERLYAREFVLEDAPSVHAYAGSVENTGFLPWSPESLEDVELFVKRRLAAQIERSRRDYDLAVCLKDTDEMIGAVGLNLNEDLDQAELGYIINMKHWRKGYAYEAAKGFLAYGFLGLELHRIYARCDDENAASYGVMEKLGMRREAHFIKDEYASVRGRKSWRSHLIYAMLQKEYLMRLPDGAYSPDGKITD